MKTCTLGLEALTIDTLLDVVHGRSGLAIDAGTRERIERIRRRIDMYMATQTQLRSIMGPHTHTDMGT